MKVAQLCPTLRDPMDDTIYGILQARILEWVAFPFSRASSQPKDWTQVSRIAGGFFTSWAIREALTLRSKKKLLKGHYRTERKVEQAEFGKDRSHDSSRI